MVTVLNSMRTSLARREIASELSLVKLMTFTACFCWDFLSSRRTVRTAERVSAGEREEASMVTSAPSFSEFEGEEGAGVVVVVVVVVVCCRGRCRRRRNSRLRVNLRGNSREHFQRVLGLLP